MCRHFIHPASSKLNLDKFTKFIKFTLHITLRLEALGLRVSLVHYSRSLQFLPLKWEMLPRWLVCLYGYCIYDDKTIKK